MILPEANQVKTQYSLAMKPADYFDRIKKMNRLIKSGATGTPSEFAKALGISQSHLFRCLHDLELYGMEIRYSRSLKTYFYGNNKVLTINYSLKLIIDSEAKEILGGMRVLKFHATLCKNKRLHLLDHLADNLTEFFNIRCWQHIQQP